MPRKRLVYNAATGEQYEEDLSPEEEAELDAAEAEHQGFLAAEEEWKDLMFIVKTQAQSLVGLHYTHFMDNANIQDLKKLLLLFLFAQRAFNKDGNLRPWQKWVLEGVDRDLPYPL
jgi:hypothetical protein